MLSGKVRSMGSDDRGYPISGLHLRVVYFALAVLCAFVAYQSLQDQHVWDAAWPSAFVVMLLLYAFQPHRPTGDRAGAQAVEEKAERLIAEVREELADKRARSDNA
jgi:hypothetical protein